MATIPVSLNIPSRYAPKKAGPPGPSNAPGLDWIQTTWTVTHSTLAMWRNARNVRITYKLLPAKADLRPRLDDLVEYEPADKEGVRKKVEGTDVQTDSAGWVWHGKGLLYLVKSHWEILGWGEVKTADGSRERWAVTWFAPTVFTKEGVDVYCDRKEGISEETYSAIEAALKAIEAPAVVDMVTKDMRPVEIRLPWVQDKSE